MWQNDCQVSLRVHDSQQYSNCHLFLKSPASTRKTMEFMVTMLSFNGGNGCKEKMNCRKRITNVIWKIMAFYGAVYCTRKALYYIASYASTIFLCPTISTKYWNIYQGYSASQYPAPNFGPLQQIQPESEVLIRKLTSLHLNRLYIMILLHHLQIIMEILLPNRIMDLVIKLHFITLLTTELTLIL